MPEKLSLPKGVGHGCQQVRISSIFSQSKNSTTPSHIITVIQDTRPDPREAVISAIREYFAIRHSFEPLSGLALNGVTA